MTRKANDGWTKVKSGVYTREIGGCVYTVAFDASRNYGRGGWVCYRDGVQFDATTELTGAKMLCR